MSAPLLFPVGHLLGASYPRAGSPEHVVQVRVGPELVDLDDTSFSLWALAHGLPGHGPEDPRTRSGCSVSRRRPRSARGCSRSGAGPTCGRTCGRPLEGLAAAGAGEDGQPRSTAADELPGLLDAVQELLSAGAVHLDVARGDRPVRLHELRPLR